MNNIIRERNNSLIYSKQRNFNTRRHDAFYSPSFKADAGTIITSAADKKIMGIFSKYFGDIGSRIGAKLYKLTSESAILQKSSRFTNKDGALLITDKKAGRLLLENLVFPVFNLPLNIINAVLKKVQTLPSLKDGARQLYNKPVFRLTRKLNELDNKTDMLKGMLGITRSLTEKFAKENGISQDKLLDMLSHPENYKGSEKLIKEAQEFLRDNLYKSGSKFFDKHTGNFNTAHERPLNRIVTGLIPAAFLANDAYNLSVMCGDKQEDSKKEADARIKQELIRIFTTAYIQLMIFGAFTKQVNTKAWFAPVTSAATVLVSEIFSRRKLGRPVFFISKDGVQQYGKKENNKENKNNNAVKQEAEKNSGFIKQPKIFTGFAPFVFTDTDAKSKKKSKDEQPKSLINFKTFKKGVIILTSSFLALSFLKNSKWTKNSALVQGMNNIGASLKKNLYDPLAYKDFEMGTEDFEKLMKSIKDAGCEEIAQGHRLVKQKFASPDKDGMFKMLASYLGKTETSAAANAAAKEAQKLNPGLSEKELETIIEAVKTAVKQSPGSIAERKYNEPAKLAAEILRNKKVNLNNEQASELQEKIAGLIKTNAKDKAFKMESKLKPFVDIITEPFKFIYASARLPFKLLNTAVNLLTGGIQKKAAQDALGRARLTDFEKAVNSAVVNIFGEKSSKTAKISQTVFANAIEQLEKKTAAYRKAAEALETAVKKSKPGAEINRLKSIAEKEKQKLAYYIDTAAAKSFNGITQSSTKNTDLALMSKLASSAVTTVFLVSDNYNMVMLKSKGKDKEGAEEKAKERIIQRLSGLFYQALFINWFNSVFKPVYNSSLAGMTAVAIPNTLTTEILTRKSIGMPIGRKTAEELNKIDAENENRKGLAGKYFKFMRLLTGKKPLKERLPKQKTAA